jgi:hypothetical protein
MSHTGSTTGVTIYTEAYQAVLASEIFIPVSVILDKDVAYDDNASNPYEYPIGAVLGKITATSKYGVCDVALSDGTEDAELVLLEPVDLYDGGTTRTDHTVLCVVFGAVKEASCKEKDAAALRAASKTRLLVGGAAEGQLLFL